MAIRFTASRWRPAPPTGDKGLQNAGAETASLQFFLRLLRPLWLRLPNPYARTKGLEAALNRSPNVSSGPEQLMRTKTPSSLTL
jgi:hypothetical protein